MRKHKLYKCPYTNWMCSMLEPCFGCEEFKPIVDNERVYLKPQISKNERLLGRKLVEIMKKNKKVK